jgi:hypothetical protein
VRYDLGPDNTEFVLIRNKGVRVRKKERFGSVIEEGGIFSIHSCNNCVKNVVSGTDKRKMDI